MGIVISKGNIRIAQGGEWIPPSDWIDIGTPANNEILLLASDVNPYYSFKVTVSGGYTVDWGDGVIDNWLSATNATHSYTVGNGKSCSRGYTTFKIRIYAQTPANNITRFIITCPTTNTQWNTLLWAKFGTVGLTSCERMFYNDSEGMSDNSYSTHLEKVSLPDSLTSCVSFYYTFFNCKSLISIDMPSAYYNTSTINFEYVCYGCFSLKTFNFNVDNIKISSMSGMFRLCYALESVKLPKFISGLTLISYMFESCYSLENLDLFDIDTNISLGPQAFNGMNSLKKLIFPDSWESRITYLYGAIGGNSLTELKLPQTIVNPCYIGIFAPKLKYFRFPDLATGDWDTHQWDYSGFGSNYNLETLDNFPPIRKWWNVGSSNAGGASGIFNYCYNLKNVDRESIAQMGTLNPLGITISWDRALSLDNLEFRAMFSGKFVLRGISTTKRAALSNLLFTNTSAVSTWAGSSPQIDIAYCSLDASALNALFTSIIATTNPTVTGKTIRITGNPGADTCDTTILTAGGKWTVNKIN